MDNLVLIGAPGSGKGTQSNLFIERKGYGHISTGNLLRAEIAAGSDLGKKVQEVMNSGKLVSDALVVELIKNNVDLENNAYIFDGYPRNIEQAETLDLILEGFPQKAVYLKIDTEKLVNRLENRRMTRDGKHIYNLLTNPPKKEGICDVTGEELIQRDDDRGDVVRDRMKVFADAIAPMLKHYSEQGILVEVDADQNLEDVYQAILSKIS